MEDTCINTNKKKENNTVNEKTCSTQNIKRYGIVGVIESGNLEQFLNKAYSDEQIDKKAKLIGTCFYNSDSDNVNNSLIGLIIKDIKSLHIKFKSSLVIETSKFLLE